MSPLVSILIPCYNAEKWISGAIESALNQSWPNKQVIVLDDGSKDGSWTAIQKFGSKILAETGANRGGGFARNRLLSLATGDWLQYLDADDYLLPDKIAEQMRFISQSGDGDVDIVFSPAIWEYWSPAQVRRESPDIPKPHDPWILLASWQLPQTGASLWRKQALTDVGGWKIDQPCCQEHELYLRLLMAAKSFAYCPTRGAVYRQWSSETVCKKDIPEVHRQRLKIEQRLENYLREKEMLTKERLLAVNQARFEIARGSWQYSPKLARQIMDGVMNSDPSFSPRGAAAPAHYRFVFHSLGFRTAETIATAIRHRTSPLG